MKQYKILTVGDGDLSFSLALKRAYPQHISLTASTLLSTPNELYQTYSNSKDIVHELTHVWKERILFGVDATHLSASFENCDTDTNTNTTEFDRIMFCHPHLGDSTLYESETQHAQRHYALLCHYLHSAKDMLLNSQGTRKGGDGMIHLCLCGNQPQSWDLDLAVKRCGLISSYLGDAGVLSSGKSTACPTHTWLFPNDNDDHDLEIQPHNVQPHYPAPRKYRNGKLGSKAFLGKYGYRHRRTRGDLFQGTELDMRVEQSVNFLFQINKHGSTATTSCCSTGIGVDVDVNVDGISHGESIKDKNEMEDTCTIQDWICPVCGLMFDQEAKLKAHLEFPALPDVMLEQQSLHELSHENVISINTNIVQTNGNHSPSQSHPSPPPPSPPPTPETNDRFKHMRSTSPPPPTSPTLLSPSIALEPDEILLQVTMNDSSGVGKRLKWFCRQPGYSNLPKILTSKKQCVEAIKVGRLYVNGVVALDSGRILKLGDVICLSKENVPDKSSHNVTGEGTISTKTPTSENMCLTMDVETTSSGCVTSNVFQDVRIVKTFWKIDGKMETTIVAFKPVGIRAVGTFSSQTLESIVTTMVSKTRGITNRRFHSITKLDTGCAGLCVLVEKANKVAPTLREKDCQEIERKVDYQFHALVHGAVPLDWKEGVFIKMPESSLRRWKRRRTKEVNDMTNNNLSEDFDDNGAFDVNNAPDDSGEWLAVKCVSSLNEEEKIPGLSTIIITSAYDSGRLSNVICFILRKIGYPVVNDRFCKREFSLLPRRMRNTIKKKLSIGCYGIIIRNLPVENSRISISPPERIRCEYWQSLFGQEDDYIDNEK